METIYEWLLHNMGNEGNFLTILNVQRPADGATGQGLDVLARTKDFEVVNLLVQLVNTTSQIEDEPTGRKGRAIRETCLFRDEEQAIAYFSTGKTPASPTDASASAIQVFVLEPANDEGRIIFPPEQ